MDHCPGAFSYAFFGFIAYRPAYGPSLSYLWGGTVAQVSGGRGDQSRAQDAEEFA